jgi:formamidopyrimidine-DNA glycosylase
VPELPEVEVVRRGLEPFVGDWTIDEVRVIESRSLRRHPGSVADFVGRLEGTTLREVVRRGKFLWWLTDDPEWALVVHLGMSGQILIGDAPDDFGRLCRVSFGLSGPLGVTGALGFVDQRIFGHMALDPLVPTGDAGPGGVGSVAPVLPSTVAHIARDPLDPLFDDQAFMARLRKKKTGIKRALLDQTLISGIGNIYADESLWRARLHAETDTSVLTKAKVSELLDAIRDVLRGALAEGGTSFDWQYVNVNGQSGYFSQSLAVYGQQGKPCPRCGRAVVREAFMNRSSHRCPSCQRAMRNRIG